MNTLPVGLDDRDLVSVLASSWGLVVERLRYVPKGFGSYHWLTDAPDGRRYFVTVDDLDTKPWLGADRDSAFEGLQAAFDSALVLHDQAHLQFVVAPVPTRGGDTVVRLTPRYSVAMFPFVDGHTGNFGDEMRREDRDRLLYTLGQLHLSTPAVVSQAPRRGVELAGRADLEASLSELHLRWTGGPFSEPARNELATNAEVVSESLASFDELAARVAKTEAEPVITHGEPHPGNLIKLDHDLLLVDWDTVALAPPERDLWMLDDGSADSLAPYREATGRAIDDTIISLYRLSWTLADIAAFAALFRTDHERNQDTDTAWSGFTGSLRSISIPTQ